MVLSLLLQQDGDNNTLLGVNIIRDCHNNIIITQNESRPSLVSGLRDCIIVNADAGTLVCHRNEIERIREQVQKVLQN